MERVGGEGRVWALAALLLAGLVFAWVLRSPINQAGSDPRGSLLVSQALLETGSIRLDAYRGPADLPSRNLIAHDGRVDYFFPWGVPLVGLPAVWLANRLGLDMIRAADEARLHKWLAALSVALALLLTHRLARALLLPDASQGSGGAGVRRRELAALAASAGMVLGSGLTSTLGTAFWSNDLAALLNLLALWLLVVWSRRDAGAPGPARAGARRAEGLAARIRSRLGPGRSSSPGLAWGRALLLGLVLFGAALARPSSAPLAGLALVYAAWVWGLGAALRLGLGMVLPALVFFAVSFWDYGQLLPPYYRPSRLSGTETFGEALLGNLISPGRGLLVFSPWLLGLPIGAIACARRLLREPLFWLAATWALLHLLAISGYPHWWDGHSYGGRPFVEALPALLLLSLLVGRELVGSGGATDPDVPSAASAADPSAATATDPSAASAAPAARRPGAGGRPVRRLVRGLALSGILALGAFSVWVHAWQGLYNLHTVMWNGGDWGPELGDLNVDVHPEYLWDWRYPQMLASAEMLAARYRDLQLRALPALAPGEVITAESDPRFFADEGWQPVERAGDAVWRWAEGPAPALRFRVASEPGARFGAPAGSRAVEAGAGDRDDAPGAGATPDRLLLTAGSFEGRAVEVRLNGSRLGVFEPARHFEPQLASFELPDGLLREANQLEFVPTDPRPAGAGDARQLGLAFRELRLEP